MNKNPVYGFEKPYLENIKKELSVYTNEAYFDDFDNLILVKNGADASKTVLVGAYASENAFLVSDITEKGILKASALIKADESIVNQRVISGSRSGYITKKDGELFIDFGTDDRKSAERIAKCGDALYLKPEYEALGNYFFTNQKAYAMKNIISALVKNEYPCKMIFVLFRERMKGAYALGKNLKADNAFFLALSDEPKNALSYLIKEKEYISNFKTDSLPSFVSESNLSFADSYYLSGGCEKAVGLAIKCERLEGGSFKFSKNAVKSLTEFLEKL